MDDIRVRQNDQLLSVYVHVRMHINWHRTNDWAHSLTTIYRSSKDSYNWEIVGKVYKFEHMHYFV